MLFLVNVQNSDSLPIHYVLEEYSVENYIWYKYCAFAIIVIN